MAKLFIDARPNYETFKIFGTILYSISIYIYCHDFIQQHVVAYDKMI